MRYKFYKKKVASKYCLLKRSAISSSTKRDSNFQEGIRRLSNTSLELDWNYTVQIMAEYSNMLRLSGYSESYRWNTISGVLKRWDQVKQEIDSGSRKLHRSKLEIKEHKKNKGGTLPSTWFLKDTITTTLSVPITPGSQLKANLQKRLQDSKLTGPDGGTTMVVEGAGSLITHTVPSNTNPHRGCQFTDKCMIDSDTRCSSSGVVYKAECQTCPVNPDGAKPTYIGTTGHNIHYRSHKHKQDVKANLQSNSLAKHNSAVHDNDRNPDSFSFKQISKHNSVLNRILTEAYLIHSTSNLVNSKHEYGQGKWITMEWAANPT